MFCPETTESRRIQNMYLKYKVTHFCYFSSHNNLIWSQSSETFPLSPFQLQISCWMAVTLTHWTSELPSKRQFFSPFTWLTLCDSNGLVFLLFAKNSSDKNQLAEMYCLAFRDKYFTNGVSKKKMLYQSGHQGIIQWLTALKFQEFELKNFCQTCSVTCKNLGLNFVTTEDPLVIHFSKHVWHLQIRHSLMDLL